MNFARLRESRDPNASRVDWLGLISFSTALLLLVLALVRGNEQGWGSPLILSLLGGHVDAVSVSPGEVMSHVQSGKLRTLAVMFAWRRQSLEKPSLS